MRDSGVQYDDRIVECVWDAELQTWKILRFRDDKREGNYKDIVQKILISIKDGVEQDTVRSDLVLYLLLLIDKCLVHSS